MFKLFFLKKLKKKNIQKIKLFKINYVIFTNFFFFYSILFKFYFMLNNFISLKKKKYSNYKLFLFNYIFFIKNNNCLINLKKYQAFFAFLNYNLECLHTYSTGFILYLLEIKKKNTKRKKKSIVYLMLFLKKYFNEFFKVGANMYILTYKFKFFKLIENLIKSLASNFPLNFLLITRQKLNLYTFKGIKAIKKRLRKKLK